jgi:DNA polymerase
MMTREDMMRELELLPVWQLRAPLPSQTQAPLQLQEAPVQYTPVQEMISEPVQINATILIAKAVPEVAIEQGLVEITSIAESEVAVETSSISQALKYIASEDGDWLFVLSSLEMANEEQQLFQNICKAMRIKTKPAEVSTDALMPIDNMHPKLLLVMGEVAVQSLLYNLEPIEALRGRTHQLHGVTLIATYDLTYLLKNPADKAKVWNDLCLGLQTLQNLNVANF